jgi:hypothetical protein
MLQVGENINDNLKIVYAIGVNTSVITPEVEKLLYRILANAKINRTIVITSTYRSAEKQAMAMINLIQKKGFNAAKALYNAKGDLVLDYYDTIKDKYKETEIIELIVIKMQEVEFVSTHSDWVKKGAVDFGEKDNAFDKEYRSEIQPIIDAAKKESKVNANQIFPPSSIEPALHIEIKLTN